MYIPTVQLHRLGTGMWVYVFSRLLVYQLVGLFRFVPFSLIINSIIHFPIIRSLKGRKRLYRRMRQRV